MKGRSQRLRPVLDPPAHLRPLLGLGHTHATRVEPQPADLSRKASVAVWMRMERGKCRADTRSSHTQHVRRIALDTEREGRAPCPIRPPADPRLDTDLPAHHLQTMHLAHVHRASRRGRPVERDSTLSLRPRADRRSRRCRRKVEGATPRAHLRTRGSVSAGRWSAAGQKRALDIVHLRRPQRADLSAEEQPRHPAGQLYTLVSLVVE